MADLADQANLTMDRFIQDSIRRSTSVMSVTSEDSRCRLCAERIGDARLGLGMDTCIDCAQELEWRQRQYGSS